MGFSKGDQLRIKNSLRNMATSAFAQTFLGIAAFLERSIFISHLNADYLGLNTLFANVLNVLSIAELGIGSAIAFALYKPLAESDHDQIASLMQFFRKAYSVIGMIIIVVGLGVSLFIDSFVSGSSIPKDDIQRYFILYLLSVAFTYFFSYKQILIEADQRRYINQLVICFGTILQYIIQIVVLIFTRNYELYILVFFFFNILKNIVLALIANKIFPALKQDKKNIKKLTGEKRTSIIKNIKAMCLHKFGDVAISSSDSIMISLLVDIKSLGLYANYQIVINALEGATRVFYSSTLASIGNMFATEDNEKLYSSFISLNFASYLLHSVITVLFFNLIQSALQLWLGQDYLLSIAAVFWISLSFFVRGIRRMPTNFHNACGLFWADRYKKIVEAIINIIVSILCALKFGVAGIFVGTVSSQIIGFIIGGRVLYKYAFNKPLHLFFRLYLEELAVTVSAMAMVFVICKFVIIDNILLRLVVNVIMNIIILFVFYYILYRKNPVVISIRNGVIEYLRGKKHSR